MERFERNKSSASSARREQGGKRHDSAVSKQEKEKLSSLMAAVVEHYGPLGVKLTPDGRINSSKFLSCRNGRELRIHESYVEKKEQDISMRAIVEDSQQLEDSDLFEQLVPILFTKIMPDKFIAVRSAKYDDYTHGVDTVIIDRDTGEVLCSVDECTSDSRSAPVDKVKKVLNTNLHGTELSYGFKRVSNNSFVPVKACRDFPLCFLSLPRDDVRLAISMLREDLSDVSDFEKEVFQRLVRGLCTSLKSIQQRTRSQGQEAKIGDSYEKMAMELEKKFEERVSRALKLFSNISATAL